MVLGLLDAISGGQLPQGNGLFPLEKAVFEPVMKHVLTNAGDATVLIPYSHQFSRCAWK